MAVSLASLSLAALGLDAVIDPTRHVCLERQGNGGDGMHSATLPIKGTMAWQLFDGTGVVEA